MKRLIIIITVAIWIVSCKKNDPGSSLTFKGRVIDFSTNAGIPDVNVKITRGTGVVPGAVVNGHSDSVNTNSNGDYEIVLEHVPGDLVYRVDINKASYFRPIMPCVGQFFAKPINTGDNVYTDVVTLDRSTKLVITVNNIPPANINDTLYVSVDHFKPCSPIHSLGTSSYKAFFGVVSNAQFEDSFSLKDTPEISVFWSLVNNGIISSTRQELTPVEFGTTQFTINY